MHDSLIQLGSGLWYGIHTRFAASVRLITSRLLMAILIANTSTHALAAPSYHQLDDRCWSQTFSDDFDQLSLWDAETGDGIWKTSYIWGSDIIINNELQYYINPQQHGISPFSVDDGILSIRATRTPDELLSDVQQRPYISGVLTTEKNFNQRYGRFEIRAQVPQGKGLWSAFWLLPSFDSWPEGVAILPEIDVMEHIGDQPRTYHTTLHTNQTGKLSSHPYDHTGKQKLTEGFHLYSVVWTPENVYWYLDSRLQASHPTPEDFTRPVHFLANLAVGGNWPGSPDRRTPFPAEYKIDYIKAWQDNQQCK